MSQVKLVKYMGNKQVMTEYGEKTKFNYSCNCKEFNEGKDFYADAWAGQVTGTWKEGMTINAIIVPRESKGKTYYNLKPMQESSQVVSQGSPDMLTLLKDIDRKLDKILANQEGFDIDSEELGNERI